MARRSGVVVIDFAVGMGPTLWKWTSPRSGTNYRLNALPIGGSCLIKGEHEKAGFAEGATLGPRTGRAAAWPDSMEGKAPATAGRHPVRLAADQPALRRWCCCSPPALRVRRPQHHARPPRVGVLLTGDPADRAGMRPGDRITAVDGVPMHDGEQLVGLIHRSPGKLLQVDYERAGTSHHVAVRPRLEAAPGGGPREGHLGLRRSSRPPQRLGVAGRGERRLGPVQQRRGGVAGHAGRRCSPTRPRSPASSRARSGWPARRPRSRI